nr:amino acid permease [Caldalkalibacillus salinus]
MYQGIALYVASILGSGVLFISGVTANVAGPASILSWLIVIMFSFPLAYTFACLSRDYPDAGGVATFVRNAFGFHMGHIVGWFYFLTAAVGQTIVSLTGAFYLTHAFDLSDMGRIITAVCVLMLAGVTNYYGVKVSGKVALYISALLLILLLIVVLISLPHMKWNNFTPFVSEGMFAIGTAVTLIFWSFFGWEAICNLAPHFKSPKITIPRSTMISVILIGALFLALSVVTIGTETYGEAESNLSPLGVILEQTLGVGAKKGTAIIALIIALGTTNAYVASLTQLGYSLSKDGAFPRFLSVREPTNHVPRRMVIFVVIFAISGLMMTELLSLTFSDILFIPTSLGLFVYIFCMAAGVKLFVKRTRPWWCSLISAIFCFSVLPFFELYILVPVFVFMGYVIYIKCHNRTALKKRRGRHEKRSTIN